MKYEFDLAIIGGGSAGLLAAEVAPRMGAKTALIERSRLGGDCVWTGCVPSKTLLASAKAAHTIRSAEKFGFPQVDLEFDAAPVWRRVRDVRQRIADEDESPERYRELGVEVVFGEASFVDERTVRVGDRSLTSRYFLVCTGSRPGALPVDGLEDAGYLTSESVFELERPPRSLIVVGAGPIGVEIAQAMNRLGVKTTLLEVAPRILIREEPALGGILEQVLRDEGVDVATDVRIERAARAEGGKILEGALGGEARQWAAEELFVATGRKPNIESLGLERIRVRTGERGIEVDKKMRSNVPSVYAVGDCVGRYLFTHSAGSETGTALRNMFYPGSSEATELIPWTTFTDPELARVGMTSADARDRLGEDKMRVYELPLSQTDRARADAAMDGRVVVVTDERSKILGAHILAPAAGEMIGQFTLAISQGARLTPELRDLVQVYPTLSTGFAQIASEAVYERLESPLYRALRRINDLLGR